MIQDGAVTVSEKNSRFIEISFFRKISFAIFYLEYFSMDSFSIFCHVGNLSDELGRITDDFFVKRVGGKVTNSTKLNI